jgi:hypothetical protein
LTVGAVALGGMTLFLVSMAAAMIAAKAWRRRRRAGRGPPAQRIVAGWQEVVDQLVDLKLVPAPDRSGTRLEIATAAPVPAQIGLTQLASESDAAAFGGLATRHRQAARYWHRVRAATLALNQSLSPWRRLCAKLSLRSVCGRHAGTGGNGIAGTFSVPETRRHPPPLAP